VQFSISSRLGWLVPSTTNRSTLHPSALLVPSAKPNAGIAFVSVSQLQVAAAAARRKVTSRGLSAFLQGERTALGEAAAQLERYGLVVRRKRMFTAAQKRRWYALEVQVRRAISRSSSVQLERDGGGVTVCGVGRGSLWSALQCSICVWYVVRRQQS
jgi:hypothetical protein